MVKLLQHEKRIPATPFSVRGGERVFPIGPHKTFGAERYEAEGFYLKTRMPESATEDGGMLKVSPDFR